MGTIVVLSNNGFFVTPENLGVYSGKSQTFGRIRSLNCAFSNSSFSSASFELSRFRSCSKSEHRLQCKSMIRAVISKESENKGTQLGKRENVGMRKRFSLRLRPRLRLLSKRLKRVSISSFLNDLGTFFRKNVIGVIVAVALGLCYSFLFLTRTPSPKVVPYSDLVTSLQSGEVTRVMFEEESRRIYYNTNSWRVEKDQISEDKSLVNAQDGNVVDSVETGGVGRRQGVTVLNVFRKLMRVQASNPKWEYSTRKIDHDEIYLLSLMRDTGITYSSAPRSLIWLVRSIVATVLVFWPLPLFMWFLRRQLSDANSHVRKRTSSDSMVTFDDVEGVDTAKVELMEIVSCLQGAINYNKLGAKLPRGVLLVGPPGSGKTLLARAVAGEAGVPFFTVSASEFVELFVGRGAARIRDLFKVARKSSPSIIFIDELDAVGGKRGRSFNDERDQTLNQLLTEMDGFDSDMKVVVIAATNRPEALDPALCRPGRFSRKVYVGEPDEEGRRKILAVHLRGVPLEEDSDLICSLVASLTPGFVGAGLANIVNEATLLAARRGCELVSREDIMEAIERAKYGINDRALRPSTISKELGKIFPWMPSLIGRNGSRPDDMQGPLGYQTL
ncbi:probable inactive ATP-dependent zinc metalloprotease FTSHI 3, chloroplastic [Rhododendron vialii]|uniref:probable inactive ATP-dependent zinc metalloprotease FTSHI 3, chloroplastic n=1 Tax=Rhododendron vialii TaxID=182163 RepID=UPI00265EF14F|nr:probable inactive ATP-dependent zinc metalloprotease FTSHI 3, chloroplastic [Rhododendron vialii]